MCARRPSQEPRHLTHQSPRRAASILRIRTAITRITALLLLLLLVMLLPSAQQTPRQRAHHPRRTCALPASAATMALLTAAQQTAREPNETSPALALLLLSAERVIQRHGLCHQSALHRHLDRHHAMGTTYPKTPPIARRPILHLPLALRARTRISVWCARGGLRRHLPLALPRRQLHEIVFPACGVPLRDPARWQMGRVEGGAVAVLGGC